MNPIGIALDLLVLGLLAWALALGLKLNGRLKALRDGHAGFAKAVAELDAASRRAEAGLAEMRRAAEETHDSLLSRIDTARALVTRLEAAGEACAKQAPSVRFEDSSPAPRESERNARSFPLPRSGGGGSSRSGETEGARAPSRDLNFDTPAPGGFADLIRRTLKEPR